MSEPEKSSLQPLGEEKPVGNVSGFIKYFKNDFVAGFLVFLIALPLCLGIALASGFPAIAGVFTAIVGAVLTTFMSNSELTIKGPAAGLIVIVVGCVEAFGGKGFMGEASPADYDAYRMALAVGVGAAVLQMLFGIFRAGVLGEFFPLSAVHGMLAAIGVIIIVKHIPIALGVQGAKGEPFEMIAEIPHFLKELNPEIALIGLVGILIMFLWPWAQKRNGAFKAVPAAMVVLVVTVPMGMYFDLLHQHSYSFNGHVYEVGETYLVNMPDRIFGLFSFITTPDFRAYDREHITTALPWVFMFFVIGSIESLLSAKAIDIIDPWKRKTNLDRDMLAVGAGNLASSFIGGLPMISEIVRSKANIDNGARTRFSDLWHGLFLLICVALIPTILHRIPLAALASMLIYTGFRLTHPKEFLHVYSIGKEQLLIFAATLVGVLATDLLIGIGIGIGVKLFIHWVNGVPIQSLFKSYIDFEEFGENTVKIKVRHSAIFSNWILFRRKIIRLGLNERRSVVLDFKDCKLVDHSVMEKLHELGRDFEDAGLRMELIGLEGHRALSDHNFAARKLGLLRLSRITVVAPPELEAELVAKMTELGAPGYTASACHGVGRSLVSEAGAERKGHTGVRLETVVQPAVGNQILEYLREEVVPQHRVAVCRDRVEVLREGSF
jgi:MFS superfamily sulfate permease-like transporter